MKKVFLGIMTIGIISLTNIASACENGDSNCKEENNKEMIMCTMQYDPVCGVDGKTYGNSCTAGKTEIAYTGECMKKENSNLEMLKKLEEKIDENSKSRINMVISKYKKIILKVHDYKKGKIKSKLIKKIDLLMIKVSNRYETNKAEEMINRLKYLKLKIEELNILNMK